MIGQGARVEADDATRGSAVKLAAEVASRLLGLATTFVLLRGLGASLFGLYGELCVYAILLAELGELGLQALASRALVAGTHSLGSLVRARLLASVAAAAAALAAVPTARAFGLDGVSLALLVAWYALSGWGEFFGVALRCRQARRLEAGVLLVLRGGALACAGSLLLAGAGLRGVCAALAASPLPALALGVLLLRRTRPPAASPSVRAAAVLRESAPLAVHGGLLLLSPRVELLVLSWLRHGTPEVGLFYAALNVLWFLSMVPTAIAAGAMPALTREALRGEGVVRRRSAATVAALAAPAAVGLAMVAPALAVLLLRPGSTPDEYGVTARALLVLAAAVPAAFLNALLAASLIAAGRTAWLPLLTATRVVLAFVLAFLLVPPLGATGAAAGLVCAEWVLLGLGWSACRRAGFGVPVAEPLAWALVACVPMALALRGLAAHLGPAVAVGVLTWAATLALAAHLAPGRLRQLTGDLRYPWMR